MSTTTTATNRITKTPDLCGGRACIEGHRIPVCTWVEYRRIGSSDARILAVYPQLTEADLAAAWEYAAAHPDEIDHDIRENEEGRHDAMTTTTACWVSKMPDRCGGSACVRDTRTPVTVILSALAGGDSYADVQRDYDISEEDIRACIAFANREMNQPSIHPRSA